MNIHIELKYKQYVGDAAIPKIVGMPIELYRYLSNAETMQQLAESEKARIKKRTSMGLDYINRQFAFYRPSTLRQKQKRSKVEGPGFLVNLINTGNMLGAINDEKNTGDMVDFGQDRLGLISFRTDESAKKANFLNNGTRKMAARPFFQVSPNDEKNFVVILEKKIAEWQVKNG